jgi:hypothetical protein
MKKLWMVAAAAAMPVGLIATAGTAGAGKPNPVDVSHATITCTSVTGVAKFAPSLIIGGTKPENINVKLALGGCTVSGVAGVTITAGKGAGVLHAPTNNATALGGTTSVTGHVNISWKSSPKLTFKMSTVDVTAVTGGVPGDGYASLSILAGNASVSNDFAGTDNGATSTMYAETTQTTATLGTEATPPSKGIKSINLGTDGTHTTPNSLHLG